MDWTGWAIGLGVTGGVLELLGILVTVLEVRDRGRGLRAYQEALTSATTSRRVRWGRKEPDPPAPTTDPTLEQRLVVLEEALSRVPAQILEAREIAIREATLQATHMLDERASEIRQEVQKLAALLIGAVSGHRRALCGVSLLIIGLILQTVSGVLGNLPAAPG